MQGLLAMKSSPKGYSLAPAAPETAEGSFKLSHVDASAQTCDSEAGARETENVRAA